MSTTLPATERGASEANKQAPEERPALSSASSDSSASSPSSASSERKDPIPNEDDSLDEERSSSVPRPSEAPFVTTLTVIDEELHEVTFARVSAAAAPPLPLKPAPLKSAPLDPAPLEPAPRAASPDVTLTLHDEELHPVVLQGEWSQWAELVPALAPPLPPRAPQAAVPPELHEMHGAAEMQGAAAKMPADGHAIPEADSLLGRVIEDKYKLLALLSRGGMGMVYEVEHLPTGQRMAMKLLSGELAADPQIADRFRQEAKATSQLTHANTVKVYDFGENSELVYLVMEYLEGRDLASLIRSEGALPFARVAKLALQICASMSEAHEQGVVHRDIKPENVFVLVSADKDGQEMVKVLDFGIAQLPESDGSTDALGRAGARTTPIQGTPYYMAPEQIRGERIDARADVYAMGALLYKALTGVAPFMAETPALVLDMHLHEPLTAMRTRVPGLELSDEVEALVARALSKDPAARQANMKALAEELTACLSPASSPKKSRKKPTQSPAPKRTRAAKATQASKEAESADSPVPATGSGSRAKKTPAKKAPAKKAPAKRPQP